MSFTTDILHCTRNYHPYCQFLELCRSFGKFWEPLATAIIKQAQHKVFALMFNGLFVSLLTLVSASLRGTLKCCAMLQGQTSFHAANFDILF